MDKQVARPHRRCVVVHSSRLVAEDLRELLMSEGAHEVVTARDMVDIDRRAACVAFVEGGAACIVKTAQVRHWRRTGAAIVAMNGAVSGLEPMDSVYTLEQPFRSEDVIDILAKIRLRWRGMSSLHWVS
jgi:hypothetical protein